MYRDIGTPPEMQEDAEEGDLGAGFT